MSMKTAGDIQGRLGGSAEAKGGENGSPGEVALDLQLWGQRSSVGAAGRQVLGRSRGRVKWSGRAAQKVPPESRRKRIQKNISQ